MGTDIHIRVQVLRKYENTDFLTGQTSCGEYWLTINPPNWWEYDGWVTESIKETEDKYNKTKSVEALCSLLGLKREWYSRRNYNLFAILANVRNGYGVAGVSTGSGWKNSIAPNRGLPEGEVAERSDEEVWLGDHSFTWMTLQELLNYDWTGNKSTLYGVVELDKFVPGKIPTNYCGFVFGHNTVTIEESEVDGYVYKEGTKVYVRQKWERTAAEAAGYFYETVIPNLKRLANEQNLSYHELRLLMGFDS